MAGLCQSVYLKLNVEQPSYRSTDGLYLDCWVTKRVKKVGNKKAVTSCY